MRITQEGGRLLVEPDTAIVIFKPCFVFVGDVYTVTAVCKQTYTLTEFLVNVLEAKVKRGAGATVYLVDGVPVAKVVHDGRAELYGRLAELVRRKGYAIAVAENVVVDEYTRCPVFASGLYVLVLPILPPGR